MPFGRNVCGCLPGNGVHRVRQEGSDGYHFHSNYRKGQEFFTGQAERKLSCHESKVQLKDQENQVEKIPLYPEGREKPNRLMENMLAIKRRGLHTLPCSIKDGSIFMPQIECQTATDYFRTLIRTDKERFA